LLLQTAFTGHHMHVSTTPYAAYSTYVQTSTYCRYSIYVTFINSNGQFVILDQGLLDF
jgi:hypothetical protein